MGLGSSATPAPWRTVDVGALTLEIGDWGAGEPVLVIGTALTSDELAPVAREPALATGRRIIAVRRRGYGASGPPLRPGSIAGDAADCIVLMDALGVDVAAVVGVSYSAAVALEISARAPDRVGAVCAIEPPPAHAAWTDAFAEACRELIAEHRALGAVRAADRFLARLMDPDWRLDLERVLPGAADRVDRDAEQFFAGDVPALLSWRLPAAALARIEADLLLVRGSDSGPWFADEVAALAALIPGAKVHTVEGGDHSLALTHPGEIAAALDAFLRGTH